MSMKFFHACNSRIARIPAAHPGELGRIELKIAMPTFTHRLTAA
jgi:hypothetical protein